MLYKNLVEVYEKLEKTSKRLEKTFIISQLLAKTPASDIQKIVYLLQGTVFPSWDERTLGMSSQLIVKVIATATGNSPENVVKAWKKQGDLGLVAEEFISNTKQRTLFHRDLTVDKVFENLQKLAELTGQGTVNRKVQLVAELVTNSKPLEAKYVVKTVIGELRIGIAEGVLRDAIVWAFFPKVLGIFVECPHCKSAVPPDKKCVDCGKELDVKFKDEIHKHYRNALRVKSLDDLKDLDKYDWVVPDDEKLARDVYNKLVDDVQKVYDVSNDFGMVASFLKEQGAKGLSKIGFKVGYPINSMLAIKVADIAEGFESVGRPLQAEYKLDGFRVQIHRDGDKVWLYTRRLENVTPQFKELVPYVKNNIKGKSFILDSEVVGFDPKTGKYLPFQNISQRIKRKYDIDKTAKEIPVEIHVFDVIYYDGKSMVDVSQKERRDLLEKIVHQVPKKIILTKKLVTDDEEKVKKFYKESLDKGFEGLILKNLEKEYTPGRKVGGWVKIKPTLEPLDLVIVGGTYGEGKRSRVISSFRLACRSGSRFLDCGMMGTGIKEKHDVGGVTFEQLTKLLKTLMISEKGRDVVVRPEIVVEVAYEEIQRSPTYESGFALRFPRLLRLRTEDKKPSNANTLDDIKLIFKSQKRLRKHKK
ncbi:MAG: ATP-dependent DNA ligase [archaeon]